jgi:hypothetical protein
VRDFRASGDHADVVLSVGRQAEFRLIHFRIWRTPMRCSFRWLVKIASCAMVLCAAIRTPAIAQESQEGRRPSRTSRPPTFLVPPGAEQDPSARRRLLSDPSSAAGTQETLSDEPTESIALTVWILRITDSTDPQADELNENLAERVGNLSQIVGSVSDVRKLVGQLKVAGMLRNAREFRLVTLNGKAVTAQRGRNQPRIVATAVDPRAGRTHSLVMEPIGTMVEMRPMIDSERNIQVSVKISESDIEKSTDVLMAEPPEGSPTFADVVNTRQFNTATSLKNKTAVLLQSIAVSGTDDDADTETELIILGAAIVEENQ